MGGNLLGIKCTVTVITELSAKVVAVMKRYRALLNTTDPLPISNEPELDPTIETALKSYEKLTERNWDGYDAEPLTRQTIDYARKILNVMPMTFGLPDIAPGGNGSVALEWHPTTGSVRKLFLDIGPREEWHAYWRHRDERFDRIESTGYSDDTLNVLKSLFERLSA
jgi:hypothetical protein